MRREVAVEEMAPESHIDRSGAVGCGLVLAPLDMGSARAESLIIRSP